MGNFVGNAVSVEYAPLTVLTSGGALPGAVLNVRDTAQFPATGTVNIGTNIVNYTAKTATTFTGCTGGTVAVAANDRVVGAYQAFTAYLKDPSISVKIGTAENSHQNDTWKRFLPGMGEASMKMTVLYEDITFTLLPQGWLNSMKRKIVAWRLRERGSGVGLPEALFDAMLTGLNEKYSAGNEIVSAEVDMQVDGQPVYAAQV